MATKSVKKAAKAKGAKPAKGVRATKPAKGTKAAKPAGGVKAAKRAKPAEAATARAATAGSRAPSLAALERGLPAFQDASKHRYGSMREILAAARKSRPVAESLQRTAGLTPDQLEELLDRHFLDIRRLDGALRSARERR